jgi:hypothetical protein
MTGVRPQHHRSLALSCLGCTAAVILLYVTAYEAYRLIGFPYGHVELSLCDWVAKRSRSATRDPRLVLLADDAPSHTLDTLWEDEIAASPVLQMMKRRNWSREIWARTIERLAGAGAAVVAIECPFSRRRRWRCITAHSARKVRGPGGHWHTLRRSTRHLEDQRIHQTSDFAGARR